MLARAPRLGSQLLARRGFQTTRAQLSSPYHYPEGPLSSIPFNPRTKSFKYKFLAYSIIGFGTPFLIAGASSLLSVLH
jgi:hypothetical protein